MALSSQELLDLIDTKIKALVTTQEVDYKIGDKSVSASDKIKQLQVMRKEILAGADADIKIISFDVNDINEFGIDNNQVIKQSDMSDFLGENWE